MKLKTQKEIYEKHLEEFPDSKRVVEFRIKERQETIKWIKKLNNKDSEGEELATIDWIKHFFNIKESKKK